MNNFFTLNQEKLKIEAFIADLEPICKKLNTIPSWLEYRLYKKLPKDAFTTNFLEANIKTNLIFYNDMKKELNYGN